MIKTERVRNRRGLREFIFLPEKLYRGDPNWSPPIWSEERQTFTPKNPILAHSDYALFTASDSQKTVGRILAYVDHSFNAFYNSKTGMFGSFESIENRQVAEMLLAQAEQWLASRGMRTVRGPIHPVSECWGFLYKGFESPPMFMSPYNPPFYNDYLEALGYGKVKDLLVYEGDSKQGYQIPQRFLSFRDKLLARRTNITVRRIRMKDLVQEAEHVCRISNEAISNNWGYVPLDKEELKNVFKKLKPIADPDAIWIVADDGHPVGYALGFPDLNTILRKIHGRLFPFGFITLLRDLKKIRDYRLFGLAVMPEYHSLGLDVLLYVSLFEALAPRRVHVEANYILEDNPKIRNALGKLELRRTKIYRVYEKSLT